ncbi:MAG TPA: sulfatase-like hydrolase/transferase [Vicinamibacterales bacterium]|nr:sulfatase-like hydrolase/transferase [Vicinamibacterales bacterium]
MPRSRFRLPLFIGLHLLASAAAAAIFAWKFDHGVRAVAAHVLVVAEWDVALLTLAAAAAALVSRQDVRWPFWTYRLLMAATFTVQAYLYALNVVSNLSWGRNITGRLVTAFAPTVWSGREPFPIGAPGITLFACGTLALMTAIVNWRPQSLDQSLSAAAGEAAGAVGLWRSRVGAIALAVGTAALLGATLVRGTASRDSLFWKQELVASFFRPQGYAFEPTARRHAVAERDALLRASYPRRPGTRRKHVVLIVVDSLRADRMQVYGYPRPTTPFLSQLVQGGRMKKVNAAFSTCSESFCGITSILAGREFRDISARTFQLQDVLSDEGYQTWFLLSGNHTAWNGLPSFYHASDGTLFDGSQTERYSMDDDRLVLEGLERVPPASPGRPAFFYVHLMSTHYLGVQFADSHVFTSLDDQVSPGLEPYKILHLLNKPDRYDDKIRQADGIIRQLFEALAAKHYLDDAIVVVTSDHGEGLGERHWAHGWNLYEEDIRIPLLLYDVPAVSYPDLSFAAQIDIAPTILDRLELPIPASWEGRSLLSPARQRFTYHQTYFVPNRFAVVYRDRDALYKFIATPEYGKEELYDLTRDRGEVRNLVDEQPQLAALLRARLRAYRDEP